MTKIETVVFDLGGVLIDWDPRHLYRKLDKSEEEIEWLLKHVLTSDWNHLMDAGKPFEEGVRELSAQFPEHKDVIEAYWKRWPEMIGGPISATVDLLDIIYDAEIPLYALTNWSGETFGFVSHHDFFKKFKGILVSGEEKLAKPDPAFFELMFERFGFKPDTALFIDDNAANIKTANSLGMHTVHFAQPSDLTEFLRLSNIVKV